MKLKNMIKKAAVILFCIVIIFTSKKIFNAVHAERETSQQNLLTLADYPDSYWYSEETGYMIDMSGGQGLMTIEYQDSKLSYFIFSDNQKYWVKYGENEEDGGAEFSGHIFQDEDGVWLVFSDFTQLNKDSLESEKQTEDLFRQFNEIIFEKVPNQHFYEYPNSVWKSEETGYMIIVPSEDDLEEDENAEVIVEYHGEKEFYKMYDLYGGTEPTWEGLCYSYSEQKDFNDEDLWFTILITEKNGEVYMTWFDFENSDTANKKSKEKNEELFTKYGEITFHKEKSE